MLLLSLLTFLVRNSVLTVGDNQMFSRIEDAVARAQSGDQIQVYPKAVGYSSSAIRIAKSGLLIQGMGDARVEIDGDQFDYSGVGSTPRAIFQIDPGATDVQIRHFRIHGAHNSSFNGAAVRINAAKNVTIGDCEIYDNDMGIMSGGAVNDEHAAENQLIENCKIHANGNAKDSGYNHNLYLGGTSAVISHCEILGSLTGHNLKSRAHFNRIEYCYIHDAANREIDLVEGWDTERAESNALLIGNVIVKDPNCAGNRGTVHFGQEKGRRVGTLFAINNTIVSPFHTGPIGLSGTTVKAQISNCVIFNGQDPNPDFVSLSGGASADQVAGGRNWISPGYDLTTTRVNRVLVRNNVPGFVKGRFNLPTGNPDVLAVPSLARDGFGKPINPQPTYRYVESSRWEKIKTGSSGRFIGAG